MLKLNNVGVIYDDVILVLKGMSMEAKEGEITVSAGRERRRQDHHLEGDIRVVEV